MALRQSFVFRAMFLLHSFLPDLEFPNLCEFVSKTTLQFVFCTAM